MKKGISIGIIVLFIISAVSPMVIGFKSEAKIDVDSEMKTLLDNLAFYCYGVNGFDSAKYEYMKEQLLEDNSNDDIEIVEDVVQPVEPISAISSGGPMDSPWSMYCHDVRHTGRSPYSTANNPYDVKWMFDIYGPVWGGPVIDEDGIIYIGTDRLYALYPNGTLKWRYEERFRISSTPAIDENGVIYVGTFWAGPEYMWAIYKNNGTLKWKFHVGDWIDSSPTIGNDGSIYFGSENDYIYALYPNGTLKWKYKTSVAVYSSPAIGIDGTVYCGSHDTNLYAFHPDDGTVKWKYKTGHWIRTSPCIADDGTIYVVSLDYFLHAVNPNGTMKWKTNVGAGTSPTIGQDGTIYAGYSKLYAINPTNGSVKWTFNPGSDRTIRGATPCNSVDGTIYFGTSDGGELFAVNPDGTEKWRKGIGGDVESAPAIGEDGTVYIGNGMDDGHLYAFGRGELQADANGPYYGLINQPVQFKGSSSGGYSPHSYSWDFGDGGTSDEQNPTHTYTISGNYTIILTVTDNSSNTSIDTTWAWIQESNDPPDKPSITGETNGKAGTKYDYNFLTSDPEGLQVWYYIEWGDGSDTGWLGPYSSGEQITKSHTWNDKDTYTIRCKAKDPYGEESNWAYLEVTMPKSKPFNFNFRLISWLLERLPLLNQMINLLMEKWI